MLTPRSTIEAPEKTDPIPAEHRDMDHSRGPCSAAVLCTTGLRPTRQSVALSDLTGLHPHMRVEEVHQRTTQTKVGVSLATLHTAQNQFREPGLLLIFSQ